MPKEITTRRERLGVNQANQGDVAAKAVT